VPRIDTSGAYGAEIVVENLDDVLAGLEEFDPKLRRLLERDIRNAMRGVARGAASKVHSRTNETADNYRIRMRRGVTTLINSTRGAAILEFAGKVHPQGLTPRGRSLIQTLNASYGSPGRIAWATWDAQAPAIEATVYRLVDDAEQALNRESS